MGLPSFNGAVEFRLIWVLTVQKNYIPQSSASKHHSTSLGQKAVNSTNFRLMNKTRGIRVMPHSSKHVSRVARNIRYHGYMYISQKSINFMLASNKNTDLVCCRIRTNKYYFIQRQQTAHIISTGHIWIVFKLQINYNNSLIIIRAHLLLCIFSTLFGRNRPAA